MSFGQFIRATAIVLRNLFWGVNLISLSLLIKPRKMIAYVSTSLFVYKALNAKRGLPERSIYQALHSGDVETIKLGNLKGKTAFGRNTAQAADIVSLCLICQIVKPKIVFEIGTLNGYSTLHFALNTANDSKIYTLDLPKRSATQPVLGVSLSDKANIAASLRSDKYYFDNSDVASRIECLYGDSAKFNFSPFHGQVDFFFIDGAHSYEYVRSDTLNALKCCHQGSVIAWHDFGRVGLYQDVTKWLLELSRTSHDVFAIPGGSLAFMVVR